MELELHQLDRRYEALRTTSRERDSRVVASLVRDGQQLPVVVIASDDARRFVLVDGYKRVRALQKLGHDLVRATCWDLPEQEALLLGRLMRSAEGESVIEQAWLVRELSGRFGLSLDDLARRFGRSPSWVSRRLGLVATLPESIQQLVRDGKLSPHAAMKHLLPLARANRGGAVALAQAIAPLKPSTRQTALLCAAFARGGDKTRAQLLEHPELLLRVGEPAANNNPDDPAQLLERDVSAVGGIARRALTRVQAGAVRQLLPPEQARLRRSVADSRRDVEHLVNAIAKEIPDAR
jgi:ParB/RepB/Spo0J family partition protein